MRLNRSLGWVLSMASLAMLGSAVGCTVIAHVDRDQIPEDNAAGAGGEAGATDGGGGTAGSGGAGGDASVEASDGQAGSGGAGGLDASDEDGGQAGSGGAGGLDASDDQDATAEDGGETPDAADEDGGTTADATDEDAGAVDDASDEDVSVPDDAADEDGGVPDDAGDETTADAGACNSLTNGAPIVQVVAVMADPPTLGGGSPLPGTYFLTSAEAFVGDAGASGPSGTIMQTTMKLEATPSLTANLATSSGDADGGLGTELRVTYDVTVDSVNHTVAFGQQCGPVVLPSAPYEVATGDGGTTEIKLLVGGSQLLTFTLQP